MKKRIFKILLISIAGLLFLNGPAQSQSAAPLNTSKPLKGEGLYAFLKRHHLNTADHKAQFMELNKGKFGKNNALLAHQTYIIPATTIELIEPLFGKDRTTYPLESQDMKGAVFYLINGHGGPDPGAIGKYGNHELHEDEYAYDITLRLAKKLRENGAKAHIIIQDEDDGIRDERILQYDNHETCMGETIPLDQLQRLKQRTSKVNALYKEDTEAYRRCLILHLDSRSKRKQIDVFFYHHHKSKSGAQLAKTLRQTFENKYNKHQPTRGFSGTVSDRNLYMLRNTTPVSVFIELGNIQNYRDQHRFVIADNRQAVANWLYEGIKKDYYKKHKNK